MPLAGSGIRDSQNLSRAQTKTPPTSAVAPDVKTSETGNSSMSGALDQEVKKLIAAKLNVSLEQVTDNARLVKDLHADGLDMVELVLVMESSFDISISERASVDFVTVKDVVKYVSSHTQRRVAEASSVNRVDWHDKQNWRKSLHTGTSSREVRVLFGEPERIIVVGNSESWSYGDASMDFYEGKLRGWFEPKN